MKIYDVPMVKGGYQSKILFRASVLLWMWVGTINCDKDDFIGRVRKDKAKDGLDRKELKSMFLGIEKTVPPTQTEVQNMSQKAMPNYSHSEQNEPRFIQPDAHSLKL